MAIPIWIVGFAMLAGYLAGQHRRSSTLWTGFGAVIGPLAALLIVMAPPGRCKSCGAAVRGWNDRCRTCGRDVRTGSGAGAPVTAAAATITTPTVAGAPTSIPPSPVPTNEPAPAPMALPPAMPLAVAASGASTTAPATEVVEPRVIGTGVYVTGSVALQPGSRYSLEIQGPTLRVRGPLDANATTVALERRLDRLQAEMVQERLVISEITANATGTVLVFMALSRAGEDLPSVAIQQAVAGLRGVPT